MKNTHNTQLDVAQTYVYSKRIVKYLYGMDVFVLDRSQLAEFLATAKTVCQS